MREEIRQHATELGIQYLVHFTRASNLPSILRHGLFPRARAAEIGIAPEINDRHRLDGHLNATSLSIAFPNYRMFYRLRNENPGVPWAVLAIHPAVLWLKDCAFCRHNAADARISNQPASTLSTRESFAGMFQEIEGLESRQAQNLHPSDPTDGQAEVLVFDVIEPTLILGVAYSDAANRDAYQAIAGNRQVIVCGPTGGYFASRSYARVRRS
jgi:hypothetical protein